MKKSLGLTFSRIILVTALTVAWSASSHAQGYARAGWTANLETISHDVAGIVTIVDEDTLQFDHFYYDGLGAGQVLFYLGTANTQTAFENGLAFGPNFMGTPLDNSSFTLDLPAGQTLDGYNAISLWCVNFDVNFGSGSFQYPRTGWQAELTTYSHNVSGTVTITDEDTLQVDNFFYDGGGIDVYFYLGTEATNAAFQNGLSIGNNIFGTVYSGDSFSIDLPPGETMDGWNAVSVWCVTAGSDFGSGTFETELTASISGSCPGTTRVDVAGLTPNAPVALVFSAATGSYTIPSGPCTGTTLGLSSAGLLLVDVKNSSSAGEAIFQGSAPSSACGRYLQVVDVTTCQTSSVLQIN